MRETGVEDAARVPAHGAGPGAQEAAIAFDARGF